MKEEIRNSRYPAIRQGMEAGRAEGQKQGVEQGARQALTEAVKRLGARRFGALPEWARQRIEVLPAADLEIFTSRLLDAATLQDLLTSART